MIFKNTQDLTDDFISIHELRKRNKLKVNYFRADQKNKSTVGQPIKSIDLSSQWDKLKTYLVEKVENMINEPIEVSDLYSNTDIDNRNLMLALDSGPDIKYGVLNLGRIQNSTALFLIINSALKKLEQFLRNIQIGFILDAETLEFNNERCDLYVDEQLPPSHEILYSAVHQDQELNLATTVMKYVKTLTKSLKKVLNSFAIKFDPVEKPGLEYFPFSVPTDTGGGNDP